MKPSIVFVLLAACSSETTNESLFGVEAGGAAGSGGTGIGGVAGVAGQDAGGDAVEASDPCGPLMLLSGSVCVDKQPALHADGSQGAAVSWTEAVTICEARGARLCTEAEREGACPDGQMKPGPLGTENAEFCSGPANRWEWSVGCSSAMYRRSPCCAVSQGFGECTVMVTETSYRCCRDL